MHRHYHQVRFVCIHRRRNSLLLEVIGCLAIVLERGGKIDEEDDEGNAKKQAEG